MSFWHHRDSVQAALSNERDLRFVLRFAQIVSEDKARPPSECHAVVKRQHTAT